MTDEELRALERSLDEAGLGDVVRYVRVAHAVASPPPPPPPPVVLEHLEQSPPLWCDITVPPGGRASDRVDVPYVHGTANGAGFRVTGLSVFPEPRTPREVMTDLAGGGLLRLTETLTGRMHEFPLRLVVQWPREPGDPPPGAPALRIVPMFLHRATGLGVEVWSTASVQVRVQVVLHGQRVGW